MGVRFEDHSQMVKRAMDEAVSAALEVCGLKAEGYAKRELNGDFGAPRRIDTGNLRNSVTHQVVKSENAVYIGTNVEYAPVIHEGRPKVAANRFLRSAVEKHIDEYKQVIKDVTS